MSLSDGFEFQVKKTVTAELGIYCTSTLVDSYQVCFYVAEATGLTFVGYWYNGHLYGTKFNFDAIPENKMHYFRYKYLNNTIYFKLLDEDMNVLSEQNAPLTLHLRNREFMFGSMDPDHQSPNTSIDLSETWFKDKDGNLISSWNK